MAKKSSKKSMKNFGLDLLVLLFSGAMFGFLAMPYVKGEVSSILGTTSTTVSGYNLLNFDNDAGMATCILLLVIFASLMALLAIVKMLGDAGIIKSRRVMKLIGFCMVFMALAVLVMTIVNMIVVPSKCNSSSLGSIISAGSYAYWLGLILSSVSALLGFVASIFAVKQ